MADKAPTVKVVKKLIKTHFKMEADIPLLVKITGAIYEGKEIKQGDSKKNDKPADLCDCVNLGTGEDGEIIVPAVVKSVLEEGYPKDGYVGKSFQITKGAKAEGKRYFLYTVDEVEVS